MTEAQAKILIIDDEPFVSALRETHILNNGHSCMLTDNGIDGLEKINSYNPDLVLLDVVMPGMDGFEVCRRIKNNPLTCDIPVIILTAAVDKDSRLKGISAGANDFLAKPVDEIELSIKIKNLLKTKKNEDLLKASLHEKEILLKEIHHRVKNSLNIVTSFLNLEAHRAADPATVNVLSDCTTRIKSISLIHEKLYQTKNFTTINFREYIDSLVSELSDLSDGKKESIELKTDIPDIYLPTDTAIPCGLIINELVTNSLKYAFPKGRKGEIVVSLIVNKSKNILSVNDNGTGLPKDFDIASSQSLGLKIVSLLTKQLDGTLKVSVEAGTRFSLTFPGEKTNTRTIANV